MSWREDDSKWPGIQEVFHGFDAETVAGFGEPELDALTQGHPSNPHRRKLDAIVGNAQRMLELDKFLGEMGCYYFLYVVGEEVPPYEEWSARSG